MMVLAIIAPKKAAMKIKERIESGTDLLQCYTFDTINQFAGETQARNMQIDRIMLLENGVPEDLQGDEFLAFTNYLMKFYPSSTIITISKTEEMAKYFAYGLGLEREVHICKKAVTVQELLDCAIQDVANLKAKYQDIVYEKPLDVHLEVVDETVEEPPQGKGSLFSKNNINKIKERSTEGPIGVGLGAEELPDLDNPDFSGDYTDIFKPVDNFMTSDEDDIPEEAEVKAKKKYHKSTSNNRMSEFNKQKEELARQTQQEQEETVKNDTDLETETETETVTNTSEYETTGQGKTDFNEVDFGLDDIEDIVENPETNPNEEEQFKQAEDDLNKKKEEEAKIKEDLKEREQEAKRKGKTHIHSDRASDFTILEIDDSIFDNYKPEQQKQQQPKVITKVVEKIVTVPQGNVAPLESIRNRNGVRSIVITGERNLGLTRLALNIANYFGHKEPTLAVDLDLERKNFITYLGVDEYIDEQRHIQDSVKHLTTKRLLKQLAHLTEKGFYTLTSTWGTDIEESQIVNLDEILSSQSEFKTMVIDCPIENVWMIPNLLLSSKVFIITGDSQKDVVNTLLALGNVETTYNAEAPLYTNSNYIVGGHGDVNNFKYYLDYYSDLFALDETVRNWGNLDVFGILADTKGIIQRLE